jgi:hypothetical protein
MGPAAGTVRPAAGTVTLAGRHRNPPRGRFESAGQGPAAGTVPVAGHPTRGTPAETCQGDVFLWLV